MTEKDAHQWITIGELAQRSGVSVPAIRFYEEKELIWSIRTEGKQRRYQRAMLRRVAIIKVAQQVGMRLQQGETPVGVLFFNFRSPRAFGPDDVAIAGILATYAAAAIARGRQSAPGG